MTFHNKVFDICHETADLYDGTASVSVASGINKFYFKLDVSEYCLTVIADESGTMQGKSGLHQVVDDSFSEYEMSDLIERAIKGGYETVYLHQGSSS